MLASSKNSVLSAGFLAFRVGAGIVEPFLIESHLFHPSCTEPVASLPISLSIAFVRIMGCSLSFSMVRRMDAI